VATFRSVVLYVFSGTGNTFKVAGMICGEFGSLHIPCSIQLIGPVDAKLDEPPADALIGIGYPVHAFNTPRPVMQAMARLPQASPGQNAFIFKVSGEPLVINAAASDRLVDVLQAKGYGLLFERHLLMPYNIWFTYGDALAAHMYRYGMAASRLLARQAVQAEPMGVQRSPLVARFVSAAFRLLWPHAALNGRLYRANPKTCTLCGTCVAGCPMKNIAIEAGRVRFGKDCAMCMYCAMYCPADAVSIGVLQPLKVNGPYRFERLLADSNLPFPYITDKSKGILRVFKRYYRDLDVQLRQAGIDLTAKGAHGTMDDVAGGDQR